VGDDQGVVLDGASLAGQPRFLALGPAKSISGGAGYFSVATASGQILYFNASTDASVGTINFSSSLLSMSSDGTVLAAASQRPETGIPPNSSVNIYSLPTATPINTFSYNALETIDISLSGSGTVLAQLPSNAPGCEAAAVAVTGGAPIWCDTTGADNVQLSPDGTLVAASTSPYSAPNPTTSIYKNGVLTTTVPGWIVGWLDNARFLADNYQEEVVPPGSTAFSLTTSAPTWLSGNSSTGVGALSGSQVVFASGNLVLAQPY